MLQLVDASGNLLAALSGVGLMSDHFSNRAKLMLILEDAPAPLIDNTVLGSVGGAVRGHVG